MDIPPELNTAEGFLDEFRACKRVYGIQLNWNYFKNREFAEKSGITEEEIQQILLEKLGPENYKKGPTEERNIEHYAPGIIYEFIYPWQGYRIYFKLKIAIRGNSRISFCMSCHD